MQIPYLVLPPSQRSVVFLSLSRQQVRKMSMAAILLLFRATYTDRASSRKSAFRHSAADHE